MARIRTIKPEFFRHAGLFDGEQETGLPLRLAFAGLWTSCDREGRFTWSPRELKLDALPYDEVDFSRVLDALRTRGHIEKYEVDGKAFGFIPSWHEHQMINNRESVSSLPAPTESSIATARCTREARVNHASATPLVHAQVEGKGKEGKGKEVESSDDPPGRPAPKPDRAPGRTAVAWQAYAEAYKRRYGAEPLRNRTVNGQMANFVERIPGDEAAGVAGFYVEHNNALYCNAQHPVNLLLRDAESLRTQWVTGKRVNGSAPARRSDALMAGNIAAAQRFLEDVNEA